MTVLMGLPSWAAFTLTACHSLSSMSRRVQEAMLGRFRSGEERLEDGAALGVGQLVLRDDVSRIDRERAVRERVMDPFDAPSLHVVEHRLDEDRDRVVLPVARQREGLQRGLRSQEIHRMVVNHECHTTNISNASMLVKCKAINIDDF